MRFKSFCLCLFLTLSVSSSIQAEPYVSVHGIERRLIPVDTGNKPAIGLLRINYRSGFLGFCTATLYQPDTLLTDKRCAIEVAQAFRTRVFFENASGKPAYEVKSSLPYSLPQSGTNNEIGILILTQSVDGIVPEPLNADASVVINGKPLNLYSYDRAIPDGEPGTPSDFGYLKRYQTVITDDGQCAEMADESENATVATFCFSGEQDSPKHCLTENRGGPVYLTGQENLGIVGIFTESEHCSATNNSLLAANIADPANQDFLIRQAGHKGRQSWHLQKDDGEQPAGYYDHGYSHCVGTFNGTSYNGYYFNQTNTEDSNISYAEGCVIFRDHTVCVTTDFSHVVGPVFAEWTTPSATPNDERISFTGSEESVPCLRATGTFQRRQGTISLLTAGKWSNTAGVCEIWDDTKSLFDCDLVPDSVEEGNLVTMPSDLKVAVLRKGQAPDNCGRNYRDELIITSSTLGVLAIAEGIAIFILSTALCRIKYAASAAKK